MNCNGYFQYSVRVQRTNYSLAGQAIGLRIVGNPDGDNGLYYMHTDHLGSTSSLSYLDPVAGTAYQMESARALYEPFGDYRVEPTGDYTDRGYTGHKENMDIGLIYMNARYYVATLNRFASADTIVPDTNNPQSFNRYSYGYNNPINRIDPTGHRSCSSEQAATGDETCDENIINYEWLAFQRRMQAQLTARYGYVGVHKVDFAPGPNEFTPENVVTRPSSIAELNAMMEAGEQAVFSLGSPVCSCHPLAGAMNGYNESDFQDSWSNKKYRQPTINLETDVLVFDPQYRGHSASVVIFDHEYPENSILIQTNQGAHLSGIFFTRLGETNIPGVDGGNYIALNLPERNPIVALAVDQTPLEIPDSSNVPTER